MAEGSVGESSLVGRSAALADLASVLDQSRWSRGGLVLITGPAGIGKTRLAEEACARAAGYQVVWNWCGGFGDGSLHPLATRRPRPRGAQREREPPGGPVAPTVVLGRGRVGAARIRPGIGHRRGTPSAVRRRVGDPRGRRRRREAAARPG